MLLLSGGQFGFQSANAFVFFLVIVIISFMQMKFLGGKEEHIFLPITYPARECSRIQIITVTPVSSKLLPRERQKSVTFIASTKLSKFQFDAGYLKNIPIALEEAACVDGASVWQTYWKIIFPNMKPMHATVAVLTAMSTWNDVMTPLVIMSGSDASCPQFVLTDTSHSRPGPPFSRRRDGSFWHVPSWIRNYNLAFASYLLALLPIMIFYIICQKQIINGVVNGAVK